MVLGARLDALENINPLHTGLILPTISLDVPDKDVILKDDAEETRHQVARSLQQKTDEDNRRIQL